MIEDVVRLLNAAMLIGRIDIRLVCDGTLPAIVSCMAGPAPR